MFHQSFLSNAFGEFFIILATLKNVLTVLSHCETWILLFSNHSSVWLSRRLRSFRPSTSEFFLLYLLQLVTEFDSIWIRHSSEIKLSSLIIILLIYLIILLILPKSSVTRKVRRMSKRILLKLLSARALY